MQLRLFALLDRLRGLLAEEIFAAHIPTASSSKPFIIAQFRARLFSHAKFAAAGGVSHHRAKNYVYTRSVVVRTCVINTFSTLNCARSRLHAATLQ